MLGSWSVLKNSVWKARAGKDGEEGGREGEWKENLKPCVSCIVVWAGLYIVEKGGHIQFLGLPKSSPGVVNSSTTQNFSLL